MGEGSWDPPLLGSLTQRLKGSSFFLGVPVKLSSGRVPLLCPSVFPPVKTPSVFSQCCSLWRPKVPVLSKPSLRAFLFTVFLCLSPQATFLASVLSSLSLAPGMASHWVGVFASLVRGCEDPIQPMGVGKHYTLRLSSSRVLSFSLLLLLSCAAVGTPCSVL